MFSRDSKSLATSEGTNIEVWDVERGVRTSVLAGHSAEITRAAFSSSGTTIASGDASGIVRLWDAASGRELAALTGSKSVCGLAFGGGDKVLYVAGGKIISVWDLQTRQPRLTLAAHGRGMHDMASSQSGDVLLTCGPESSAKVFLPENFRIEEIWTGKTGDSHPVAFSPDSRTLVVAGQDNRLETWNLEEGNRVSSLTSRLASIGSNPTAMSVPSQGQMVVVAGDGGEAWILDHARQETLAHLLGHTEAIWDVALSPDSSLVASCSDDRSVRLWDTATGEQQIVFSYDSPCRSVAFSPDGRILAVAADNGVVHLLRVADRDEARLVTGDPEESPLEIAYSRLLGARNNLNPTQAIEAYHDAQQILSPLVSNGGSRTAAYLLFECFRDRAIDYANLGQEANAQSDLEASFELYQQLGDVDDVYGQSAAMVAMAERMNSVAWSLATRRGATLEDRRSAIRTGLAWPWRATRSAKRTKPHDGTVWPSIG